MVCRLSFSRSQHSWQPVSQLSLLGSTVSGRGPPLRSHDSQPAAWGLGLPSSGLDCHLCPSLRWPVAATLRRFLQKPRISPKSLLVSLLPTNESSPEALLLVLKAWVKWPCTQTSQAPLRRGQASSRAGLRGNIIRRGPDHGHLVVRCQGRRVGHKPRTAE